MHHYQDLIRLFNQCFEVSYNTRLIKGEDEPIYLPKNETQPYHAILFAHGFYRSALHECAHWFIAGKKRRLELDYGYWYAPDGRNQAQQTLFESVEIKPQAIEWIITQACQHPFHISCDNLNGEEGDTNAFKKAVHQQVLWYCLHGLPARAALFRQTLCRFYHSSSELSPHQFQLSALNNFALNEVSN